MDCKVSDGINFPFQVGYGQGFITAAEDKIGPSPMEISVTTAASPGSSRWMSQISVLQQPLTFVFDDSRYALWEFPYAFFLWEILYGLW